MSKLVTAAERAAKVGRRAAFVWVTFAGTGVGAAPPESDRPPSYEALDLGTGPSSDLPVLPSARPPALQLLCFDPSHALQADATVALAEEVRSIFRTLGVEVAFRMAAPDTIFGEGSVLEVPIILLEDDPIVARRPNRVLGLVVRDQEPSRAVWAFLKNLSWTLGRPHPRGLPAIALGRALGRVVAHEVIHAIAPDEPHSKAGLMGHSMNRTFLLSDGAPLDARCQRAFLSGLAAHATRAAARAPAAALASVR